MHHERITSRQRWTKNSEVRAGREERQKLKGRVKNREKTNQGERRERYSARNRERQGEGNPQSQTLNFFTPNHPCIPKAARELQGSGCGGAGQGAAVEPTAQGPQPPSSPFVVALQRPEPGARRSRAWLSAPHSLPRSRPFSPGSESSWERKTGDRGAGRGPAEGGLGKGRAEG